MDGWMDGWTAGRLDARWLKESDVARLLEMARWPDGDVTKDAYLNRERRGKPTRPKGKRAHEPGPMCAVCKIGWCVMVCDGARWCAPVAYLPK